MPECKIDVKQVISDINKSREFPYELKQETKEGGGFVYTKMKPESLKVFIRNYITSPCIYLDERSETLCFKHNGNSIMLKMPPVVIYGPPGIGKSQIIRSIAHELKLNEIGCAGIPDYVVLDATTLSEIDIMGVPFKEVKGRRTIFARPEILPPSPEEELRLCGGKFQKPGILFIDDLGNVKEQLQSALYAAILERRFGYHKISDRWRIIAATNRKEDQTGAKQLLPALANRFALHIEVEPDWQEWLMWAERGDQSRPPIEPELIEFVRWYGAIYAPSGGAGITHTYSKVIETSATPTGVTPSVHRNVYASPRSWDNFDMIYKNIKMRHNIKELPYPIDLNSQFVRETLQNMAMSLGILVVTEFQKWLTKRNIISTPEELFEHFKGKDKESLKPANDVSPKTKSGKEIYPKGETMFLEDFYMQLFALTSWITDPKNINDREKIEFFKKYIETLLEYIKENPESVYVRIKDLISGELHRITNACYEAIFKGIIPKTDQNICDCVLRYSTIEEQLRATKELLKSIPEKK